MRYQYSTTPATPTVATPQQSQTFTDPQVSFKVNPVGDVDGDHVQYYYRIATGSDGESGTIINSGDVDSTQWTVPDGVLQDGQTYYLHVYSRDPYAYSTPSAPIKFTVDSRQSDTKTQTYDTVGPMNVDLTNGDASTSISSHSTSAIGGNLGVSLNYDSLLRSRAGLVGSYWNNTSESGSPALTRVDQNIAFDWNVGSPSAGIINNDSFSAQWKGYFVAPATGTYYFGGSNDDGMTITLNGQALYSQNCYTGICYDATKGVTLTAGQAVPIQVDYLEGSSVAYAKLYVKGAVTEQIVPQNWLQTGARPVAQPHGLTGSYYANNSGYNLDAAGKQLLVRRADSTLSFSWGTAGPVPGSSTSDFMVRWTGYVKLAAGDYQFGTNADDGARISIGGNTVVDNYTNGCCAEKYGSTTHFNAGTYPIRVDYYDTGGPASFAAMVKVNGATTGQIIPSSWLSPSAQTLPSGWQLGIDPDGSLNYDHVTIGDNSATLSDSSGDTHVYTWTGSAYKPPVNEDGQLVRNNDGTLTLTDSDGRTYIFNTDGTLASATSPVDDRQPAALKYTYAGTPAHITKISDGVDGGRYAAVYYSGDGQGKCTAPTESGFIDPADDAVNGYICAVQTNDGRITSFYYSLDSGTPVLSLVVKPGNERTSYQYDSNGMLTGIRNSLAEDAIAAGVRANDDSVLTQIDYDALGRVTSVTAPAPTAGASRQQQTIEYLPGAMNNIYRLYRTSPVTTHISTTAQAMANTTESWLMLAVPKTPQPGTHAVYRCQRPSGAFFAGSDPACYGNTNVETLGYFFDQPTGSATVPYSRLRGSDGYVLEYPATSLTGWTTEEVLGYGYPSSPSIGVTEEHLVGATEPNGYSRRVDYDSTFRTTKDTDATGNATTQAWDAVKDLLYSTTDATGLKSTTVYDDEDRPTDSYGPAPAAWFGADNKPLAAYVGQVPHTNTNYDQGIVGPAVAWYNYKSANGGSLVGAPKLHTTGFDTTDSGHLGRNFINAPAPITPDSGMDGYGFEATGKIRFPSTGTYTFKLYADDSARLSVNDMQILGNWGTSTQGITQNVLSGTFNATASTPYRFNFQYGHSGDAGGLELWLAGPGITDTNNGLGTSHYNQYLSPDYSLVTSTTTDDSTTGNSTTSVNYGANPELSQAQSVTSGDLTSRTTYESPTSSTGFLRATNNTSAGSTTTAYAYYDTPGTAPAGSYALTPDPCTPGKSYAEGGRQKLKTSADPDGSGPQTAITTETVYDDAGKVVAVRTNNDPWTCTTYDVRGRVTQVVQPDINGRAGRTVTTNYNYQGSPFKTQNVDSVAGSSVVTIDLLGRQVSGTDTFGNDYSATYDNLGRTTARTSPIGSETYSYDDYGRPTSYSLNSTTYATMSYDAYSRTQNIQYPQANDAQGHNLALSQVAYDALQRTNGATFQFSNGTTFNETVNLSQSDDVTSVTDNLNGVSATSAYSYDNDGRLAQATVDNMRYTYDYSAPSAGTCGQASANLSSNKNSDRTSFTATNLTTNQVTAQSNYCYDQADRLISSSDTQLSTPTYDDHGNTTSLAGNGTPLTFTYDANDQNTAISQGQNKVTYLKTADGSILRKKVYQGGTLTKSYRYVSGGQILQTCSLSDDTQCANLDTYLSLPGGVSATLTPSNPDTSKRAVYSVSNFHGDTALTVSAQGNPSSSVYLYEPFGQPSASATFGTNGDPSNTSDTAKAWAGKQSENLFSLAVVQMGARVYIPGLGRFLQVDPIEGGTPSAYGYVADPINDNDYSGMFGWSSIVHAVKKAASAVKHFVQKHIIPVVAVAVAVVVTGFLVGRAAETGNTSVAPTVARSYTATTNALNRASNAAAKAVQAAMKALSTASRSDPAPEGPPSTAGSIKTAVNSTTNLMNKNNILRVSSNRISIGPSPQYYNNGSPGSRIPFHIHIDSSKGFIQDSRTGELIKMFWGEWNE